MAETVESYEIDSIDRREVLRYLGYTGQPLMPELDARIDGVVASALALARPRGCVAVFDVDEGRSELPAASRAEEDLDAAGAASPAPSGSPAPLVAGSNDPASAGREDASAPIIRLKGTALELRGHSIAEHLAGARAVGVMAVTIGMGIERELRRLSLTDSVAQVIFDSCGSTIVERAADAAEASLMARARERGLYTNSRFSPGYGDLPMSTQPALLSALNAQRRLGVTLTSTLLMTPTKSVSALVGMFDRPQPSGHHSCKGCLCFDFCNIRPTGRTCRD